MINTLTHVRSTPLPPPLPLGIKTGLPAWLLQDKNLRIRGMFPPFRAAVERYFMRLSEIIAPLQAESHGPVIAFQVGGSKTVGDVRTRGHTQGHT